MDDFILLLDNKKQCIEILSKIEAFLDKNLKLKLNHKSRYYPNKMGVNFCGYRIFQTHKLLRLRSKRKIKSNVKKWNYLYSKKRLNFKSTINSLNSWIGHAKHGNSYNLQQKVLNSCDFIYNNKALSNIENDLILQIEKNEENL